MLGTSYDSLKVNGAATLAGTLMVNLVNFTPTPGHWFDVVQTTGGYTGQFTLNTTNAVLPAGEAWRQRPDPQNNNSADWRYTGGCRGR